MKVLAVALLVARVAAGDPDLQATHQGYLGGLCHHHPSPGTMIAILKKGAWVTVVLIDLAAYEHFVASLYAEYG